MAEERKQKASVKSMITFFLIPLVCLSKGKSTVLKNKGYDKIQKGKKSKTGEMTWGDTETPTKVVQLRAE